MSTAIQIASQLLEKDRDALAELVLTRLEQDSRSQAAIQSAGRKDWIYRIDGHLHTLSACIRFASPRLLADYVRWGNRLATEVSPLANEIATVFQAFAEFVRLEFPSEPGEVICNCIQAALDAADEVDSEPSGSTNQPLSYLQQRFLSALLAADRAAATRLAMEAIDSGISVSDFYLDVLQASQKEVGRLWQTGQITVAQEHYCTAATQFVMAQLQPFFLQRNRSDKILVAACVGDELHEVGLRIVSDLFEMNGWYAIYLGANVPAESVAKSLSDCGAHVLAISTTMTRHLFALNDQISVVRLHPDCQGIKILVGGYPFNVDPFLWRRVGADAAASGPEEAIRIANRFFEKVGSAKTPDFLEQIPVEPSDDHRLWPAGDAEEDLSRLNNELITAQRKLNKANLELSYLNELNKAKTKALEEADRRKNEFLAMLAHELRGPLAPMNHALAIMRMKDIDESIVAEARDTIDRQVQQMTRLVSDLLDASRIAHGKIQIQKKRVELSSILERAVEIARPLIDEKCHELIIKFAPISIALEADEIRLVQVIANVLTNAAKYTQRGGMIELSSELENDQAVIKIRDNGIGIDANSLGDVFSAFTQEQRAKEHFRGGLGLGLNLVKRLVELHHGTVRAESDGPGKGCTFTLVLPALEPGAVEKTADVDQTPIEPSVRRRVLVVDDTAGIAKITSRLFEVLGHETSVALDGASAIETYGEFRPEIVLLDLILPDMPGVKVAQKIRERDADNKTLIVALTGNSDERHRRLAQEAGFDEFFVKPVDVNQLKKLAVHDKLTTAHGRP